MALAVALGLSVADLDTITIGMLNDLACFTSGDNGKGDQLSYDDL